MMFAIANVLKEGASASTLGWLMGVMTVFFMGTMVLWIAWTWLPSRRAHMDEVSRLPLEED